MKPTALKVAIVEANTTQTKVARRARVPLTRFNAIVNDRLPANEKEQKRIAKALNTTPEQLFSIEVSA